MVAKKGFFQDLKAGFKSLKSINDFLSQCCEDIIFGSGILDNLIQDIKYIILNVQISNVI